MKKLPALSDGKPRFISKERHAELVILADRAGKSLVEFLEFGGASGDAKKMIPQK